MELLKEDNEQLVTQYEREKVNKKDRRFCRVMGSSQFNWQNNDHSWTLPFAFELVARHFTIQSQLISNNNSQKEMDLHRRGYMRLGGGQ